MDGTLGDVERDEETAAAQRLRSLRTALGRVPRLDGEERARPEARGAWLTIALVLVVLVPTVLNAIWLLPEARSHAPSLNDDAFHFLMIQRGSDAWSAGENPLDHWSPELEMGAPRFAYYQHVPHAAVILLNRLAFEQIGLLTMFNIVRYALMLGLPVTVYWSMRRMDFSRVAAAFAAAASTLLSAGHRYGFEYDSYVFRGFGMYSQLWAMHLTFIVMACLYRLFNEGKGFVLTVAACSLLVLSHLLYAEMMIVTGGVVFLAGVNRRNVRARAARAAAVAALTAAVSSYLWLPFFQSAPYVGDGPYVEAFKLDSFGPRTIMSWLVHGKLLDSGRLPVLTALAAAGIGAALLTRAKPALMAVALFAVWLVLYFGRDVWGPVADRLPFQDILWFHRFIGGVQLAAILLIGVAADALWRLGARLPAPWRAAATAAVLLALLVPAMRERQSYYDANTTWMDQTEAAIDADADAQAVLSVLAQQPPGRTYAGLRNNFGATMNFGLPFNSTKFTDLLTFHQVPALSPPYQSLTLNSDLMFNFNDQDPGQYDLFNVRYVIAPAKQPMPAFLQAIKTTPRYTLYRAQTSGYAGFASATERWRVASKKSLFAQNKAWLASGAPAARKFLRYDYPAADTHAGVTEPGCPSGTVSNEVVGPGRYDALVQCDRAATVVLKMTYHPDWHVTVDGRPATKFMVSPSFIGVEVPAGLHHIHAEYDAGNLKYALLAAGAALMLLLVLLRGRIARLDARLFSKERAAPPA